MTSLKKKSSLLGIFFWLLLATFIAWDYAKSVTIDLRQEPPLMAAGSGKTSTSGHCSLPK